MKKIVYIILLILECFSVGAQNQVQLTNFGESMILYNPSFCGINNKLNFTVLSRQQWIGLEEPPSTQIFTFNTYIRPIRGGFGLILMNDKLGQENSNKVKISYAYKFILNRNTYTSIGASYGIFNYNFDAFHLNYEEYDPLGLYYSISSYMSMFDMGIFIKHKMANLAFSILKTFENMDDEYIVKIPYYIQLYGKYYWVLKNNFVMIPGFCYHKTIKISSIMVDNQFLLNDKFLCGISYRFKESASALVGYKINKSIKIGYSYDYSIGRLHNHNLGSHEVFMSFSFEKPEKKYFYYKSPRFF